MRTSLLLSQKKVMKSLEARVSVYERRGNYQIYVNKMELDGIGNLYQKLEQLKQKLKKKAFLIMNIKSLFLDSLKKSQS